MVTPRPAATKSAVIPSGGVSSAPSTLAKSIDQAFTTGQNIVGLLDQMNGGGGVDLCAPLIAQYQSMHNAPAYDMSAQSNEMQQAYAAYRQGIDLVDSRARAILAFGQGDGSIGGEERGLVRQAVSKAVDLFGQAHDAAERAATISTASPLPDAVTSVRVMYFISRHGKAAKVRPDMKVVFFQEWETPEERVEGTTTILRDLAELAEGRKAA